MGLPSWAFCSPQQWAEAGAESRKPPGLGEGVGAGRGESGAVAEPPEGCVDRRQSGLGRGVTQQKEQQLPG